MRLRPRHAIGLTRMMRLTLTLCTPSRLYLFAVALLSRLGFYTIRVSSYVSIIYSLICKRKGFIRPPSDLLALDIGVARGEISNSISNMLEINIIGLDVNKNALKNAPSSLERIVADAHFLPFRSKSFNLVLLISTLEHLHKPNSCVKEIERVLQITGLCVLQLPNLQWFLEPHTKWPLMHIMPSFVARMVKKYTSYDELNLDTTFKNVVAWFAMRKLTNIERVKVNHGSKIINLVPWPPAWFLLFEKK